MRLLAYIWLALKRHHVIFIGFDQIITLRYDSFTPVLKLLDCSEDMKFVTKKYKFCRPSIRMSKKSINFGDEKINKNSFHKNKKLFKIGYIYIQGKYFIGYDDNDVIRSLCIRLPQMFEYINSSGKSQQFIW